MSKVGKKVVMTGYYHHDEERAFEEVFKKGGTYFIVSDDSDFDDIYPYQLQKYPGKTDRSHLEGFWVGKDHVEFLEESKLEDWI